MQMLNKYIFLILIAIAIYSCSSADGNNPGTEYMPDMGHSIAYEANLYDYYYYNTWGTEEAYYASAQPRKPVANTIPRGYAGIAAGDDVRMAAMQGYEMNGYKPYDYEDTEEERARAAHEIIENPFPITAEGLVVGKELYDINCGICHGPAGDGEGYLISENNPNAVYPAQPAILTADTFTNASNGQLYHAIMYGKNVMGGYADKLSYKERWEVIHYIRSLQAKNKKLVYNETENTLNSAATPFAQWEKEHAAQMDTEGHGDTDEAHEAHEAGEEMHEEHDAHEQH